ncbi:MAG: GntR family transcriptional regulator [Rikenellaceae bacterium]
MNFNESKPIYLQIADLICDKIVNCQWQQGDRILSVRDMGSELEVNPNTVMRAYEWLAEKNIIYNKRGVGFFISADALASVRADRREQLLNNDLREIAKRMQQLDITVDEVASYITDYLKGNFTR